MKCYCRYADDTFLFVKPADILHIKHLINLIKTYAPWNCEIIWI